MAGACLVMALLLSPIPTAAEPLTDTQLLERAETEFRTGRETRADRQQSRGHFARAAESYETLRKRGYRNADLLRNQGNAYLLAGDLPHAILAYRRGLRLAPGDRQLRANLAVARAEVAFPSPGSFGRPPQDSWLSWIPRPRPTLAYLGTALAFALFWVALTRYCMIRRSWLLNVAQGAMIGGVILQSYFVLESWNIFREIPHHLVVVARDGVVLRKGNGPNYPPRNPTPLNRGVEAQELFMRGNWLQIRLAGGEVGWVPFADVLVDTDTWF